MKKDRCRHNNIHILEEGLYLGCDDCGKLWDRISATGYKRLMRAG